MESGLRKLTEDLAEDVWGLNVNFEFEVQVWLKSKNTVTLSHSSRYQDVPIPRPAQIRNNGRRNQSR